MRIVFYSHMSQLGNGGVESLFGLVKELSKTHECCVITASNGELNDALNGLGIKNVVLPFKWSSGAVVQKKGLASILAIKQWFANKKYNNKVFKDHINFLTSFKPNIIYSNTSVINIGIKLAEKINVPHLWHLREFQMFDMTPDFGYRLLTKYLNKSTLLVVNSQLLKTYYEQFVDSNKINVVYNGIDVPKISKKKAICSTNVKPFKFIVVGSLISRKSQMDALKAVKKLKSINTNFQLHIVGEGRLRPDIENYIECHNLKKEVILHGHQSEVDKFYAEADCYIMCSEFETFGRVTVEAMLCAVPIIGRNAPYNATKEIIRNGVDGYLYTTSDELVEKMLWMMNNQHAARIMGTKAQQHANDNFLIQNCVQQLEKIMSANLKEV